MKVGDDCGLALGNGDVFLAGTFDDGEGGVRRHCGLLSRYTMSSPFVHVLILDRGGNGIVERSFVQVVEGHPRGSSLPVYLSTMETGHVPRSTSKNDSYHTQGLHWRNRA